MSLLTSIIWFMTVFGMNVGGVPWTNQNEPELKEGFHNVMLLCVALILLVLLCFLFPVFYASFVTWKRRRDMKRSWSLNQKSFLRRTTSSSRERNDKGGYQQLYWKGIGNKLPLLSPKGNGSKQRLSQAGRKLAFKCKSGSLTAKPINRARARVGKSMFY